MLGGVGVAGGLPVFVAAAVDAEVDLGLVDAVGTFGCVGGLVPAGEGGVEESTATGSDAVGGADGSGALVGSGVLVGSGARGSGEAEATTTIGEAGALD